MYKRQVKHITKPEVVRRLKEIGTHQQQDPRISVAWRSAVTNSKPGFHVYGGKLYKLCSHTVSYTHLDVYKRQIQEYQFEIQYCKAKNNLVADVLSRNTPSENNMETDNIKCSSNDIGIYAVKHITKPEVVRRLKEVGTHQQQDPRISVAWRRCV